MTDTPTIALYYKEHDPMKRKMFLDQSIAAGKMKRQMLFEKKSGRFAMAVLQNWDRIHAQMDTWHCGWPWNTVKMLLKNVWR